METEMLTFIRSLFGACLSSGTPGFLTLTAIHPDGNCPTPSCHIPLGDASTLETALHRLLTANHDGWGAHFGVATRTRDLGRWSRGGKRDLSLLPALFVDIDAPETALVRLAQLNMPPTYILASGHGYHAYWQLGAPTSDMARVDKILRGLAQYLGGDSALSVAHSMRLPGTWNTKRGRDNTRCTVIHHAPQHKYALSDFARFEPPPTKTQLRPCLPRGYTPGRKTQAIIGAITDAVMHFLDGHPRHNGYIAARCPLPHLQDRPGMHFSYHPSSGWGRCFGKHGVLSLQAMRDLLGVAA